MLRGLRKKVELLMSEGEGHALNRVEAARVRWLLGHLPTRSDACYSAFDFFKKVVTFHPIKLIGNAIDYHYSNGWVWYALITMLYIDILDMTRTLYSMARFAGLHDPVTLDFECSTVAYCVDVFSISMGVLMGTSCQGNCSP